MAKHSRFWKNFYDQLYYDFLQKSQKRPKRNRKSQLGTMRMTTTLKLKMLLPVIQKPLENMAEKKLQLKIMHKVFAKILATLWIDPNGQICSCKKIQRKIRMMNFSVKLQILWQQENHCHWKKVLLKAESWKVCNIQKTI